MANITASDVKELREMTGCGMMDCKRALVEADGNRDEAVKILREKGLAKAAKKAGRIAAEGIVKAKVSGTNGVIVEINCETDFCAKSDKFLELVETITDTILANDVADVEALKNCTVAGGSQTVAEYMTEKIATIGENMKDYRIHAILLQFIKLSGITALNAQYVSQTDIPADVLANEKEVQLGLVKTENAQSAKPKPENVLEKIVEGRLRKYFEEVCLLDPKYFKDDTMTIGKYVESEAKAAGASIKVESFVRYERGEGIEKKQDDFASEVAAMAKG